MFTGILLLTSYFFIDFRFNFTVYCITIKFHIVHENPNVVVKIVSFVSKVSCNYFLFLLSTNSLIVSVL